MLSFGKRDDGSLELGLSVDMEVYANIDICTNTNLSELTGCSRSLAIFAVRRPHAVIVRELVELSRIMRETIPFITD